MSECEIFNKYQERAKDISEKINASKDLEEKAKFAQELLDLEKDIKTCEQTDDPKCRLQRKVVIPARRKIAQGIIRMYQVTGGDNG